VKYLLLFFVLATTTFASQIKIAVAANVSYAIDELLTEFSKTHPNTKVQLILGSSGKLTAQIANGAPYGLFMSADMNYPQMLFKKNLALAPAKVYAQGRLAILSKRARSFKEGIKLLTSSQIRKIAIANPKTAPYGQATIQALKNAKVFTKVFKKFVYAESISQTVAYAITAADLGIIATSSLYSSKMRHFKEHLHWKNIDTTLYTPIKQGIVLLKKSKTNPDYKAFYNFIFTPKAQEIFKKYGYIIS